MWHGPGFHQAGIDAVGDSPHQETVRPNPKNTERMGQSSGGDKCENTEAETKEEEEGRWDTEARKAKSSKNLELPTQKNQ